MEPKRAVHGGDFFHALGEEFRNINLASEIVNADVLDAWYGPSPRVIEAIQSNLEWLIKTSPPTHGDGLRSVIADARGIKSKNIVVGSGSSSLMFLALPKLIGAGQTAVILDPMYGEYAHILEHLVGADIRRFALLEENEFEPDLDALALLCQDADLLVMVNPNSPTGVGVNRADMERLLAKLPRRIKVWVDETYIDFMPGAQSLETLVADDPRLIVSKSMSKYYSLSGLRVGYLVCDPDLARELEEQSPPWAIGMIGQLAAIEALRDSAYYEGRAAETHEIRQKFARGIAKLRGMRVFPSTTNYLMVKTSFSAAQIVARCAQNNVYLRNCDSLSPRFQDRFIRVAVKSPDNCVRILDALREASGIQ